ncbi:MAG: DUF971 domain-containing protein [Alphaproteobacteria bacterium]|nr:DUF971 domain-containing protein [Alphaproteobacteria bacterium]
MTDFSSDAQNKLWPTALRLSRNRQELLVQFEGGIQYSLPAEYLRVESPSAEVRGHTPDQRKIIPRCPDITITALEPVGHYAVRIIFSDGHDSGLYAWTYLQELGENYGEIWAAYLAAVK